MCFLTFVSVCDIVELGTYGKLKYYHSMTEEGKTLSVDTHSSLFLLRLSTHDAVCSCV